MCVHLTERTRKSGRRRTRDVRPSTRSPSGTAVDDSLVYAYLTKKTRRINQVVALKL